MCLYWGISILSGSIQDVKTVANKETQGCNKITIDEKVAKLK